MLPRTDPERVPIQVSYPGQKFSRIVNQERIVAMSLSCIMPIGFIVVTVIDLTLGWASALALGLATADVCAAVIVQHMRQDADDEPGRSPNYWRRVTIQSVNPAQEAQASRPDQPSDELGSSRSSAGVCPPVSTCPASFGVAPDTNSVDNRSSSARGS